MFEPVYTMTDHYDGPRRGIARFRGVPHVYESRWSDIDTDECDTFLLMPITAETFELALEDWAIWRRWRAAFDEGRIPIETHPALSQDSARHVELHRELGARLAIDESRAICAKAIFRSWDEGSRDLEGMGLMVEWTIVCCQDYPDNRDRIGHD